MKTNKRQSAPMIHTHEGAPARNIPVAAQLRRSVCSCLLWEDTFYEDGMDIGDRIAGLVHRCPPDLVAALAIEARKDLKLRHVPLLLVRELARHPLRKPKQVSKTLARVIRRADEMAEFLALYWKGGKTPISKQVKRGLAWSLRQFDEYQLAKYNRDHAVRARDVMFATHPIPKDITDDARAAVAPAILRDAYKRSATLRHETVQGQLWNRLASDTLASPQTWENRLSAGEDKKQTFEDMLRAGKLGYMALLKNLRNMQESGCDVELVKKAILARKGAGNVLPFRFISAAKAAPQFERELDKAMIAAMAGFDKLMGRTVVLVDNSGSMYHSLAGKSDLSRADAAAGLAILAVGMAENVRVYSFSDTCVEVPPRNGMGLRDAVQGATEHGSTMLGEAVTALNRLEYERLIIITDEQSADRLPNPRPGRGYIVNVASFQNGVGYGPWVHIDGFSEATMRFIDEADRLAQHDAELRL